MAGKGAFSDLDAAMLVHPDVVDIAVVPAIGLPANECGVFGKAAHASANPAAGVNALDAMILSFNSIMPCASISRARRVFTELSPTAAKRRTLCPTTAPANSMCEPLTMPTLTKLIQKVLNCFIGAGLATGARMEYKPDPLRYASMSGNMVLAGLMWPYEGHRTGSESI